jgi:hypothetical protein
MPDLIATSESCTMGLGSTVNGSSSNFYYDIVFNTGLTDGKITIKEKRVGTSWTYGDPTIDYDWYAIGVGEEDTTLRDSLASILQEEGVSVSDEDDMASLIGKVDEEFDNSLKHASGTYTPTSKVSSVTVPINLSFTPTYFVVNITGIGSGGNSNFNSSDNNSSIALSTDCPNNDWYLFYTDEAGGQHEGTLTLTYSASNFRISGGDTTYRYFDTSTVFTWHAFG